MRKVVVQIFLILGSAYCSSQNQSSLKCREIPGEDVNNNIQNALHSFKNCFLAHVANFRHTVAANSCSDTTLRIQECDSYIVNNITACSSPDTQYFPKSVFSLISDYAGYICSNAPQYKLPILLDHKTCFPLLEYGIDCFENFRFFNTTAIISKEEMCSDEKAVQECLENYANTTCSQDNTFLQILNDTFKFNEPPCKDGTTRMEIYNFALFVITIFVACSEL